MKNSILMLLCLAAFPALAYDVNSLRLGGREIDVKKAHPSAYCKALEWKSDAADRRCDDAQASLGGVQVKITVFLKADVIQAIDLRFAIADLERVKAVLRDRWGKPLAEVTDNRAQAQGPAGLQEAGGKGRRAILTAQLEQKRARVGSRAELSDEITGYIGNRALSPI